LALPFGRQKIRDPVFTRVFRSQAAQNPLLLSNFSLILFLPPLWRGAATRRARHKALEGIEVNFIFAVKKKKKSRLRPLFLRIIQRFD
jgi:hypothetical protein